ncbi:MAG: 23S rRNA (guanosine(2251)-2'-O)-methyltransferase RlmB [Pseudomonadota bacterium]
MAVQWFYGLHAVQSLLENDFERVLEVIVQPGRDDERITRIQKLCAGHGIHVRSAGKDELPKITGDGQHQGVAARARDRRLPGENELAEHLESLTHPPLLLVLDGVTDPHNFGAVLRSADGFGVDAVVITRDKAAGITPVVAKTACGAAETVTLFEVVNLVRALELLKEKGVWVAGAALDPKAESIYTADLTGPLAIVLGAEGAGMRRLTREHCDRLLMLPMAGWVDSLNVSVAAGVFLFAAARQRPRKGRV